ncbi:RNA-binding domain-containing protein [Punctularia strigosozonata HHB-11173 SS5]|uniref:RNA-binding domain-containing protein n=1 Tax=Punctularia strigosozonata (strain HHB-11173) TaxID=741275 RepID=UPI000441648B|nr:RNA-binding domain-containing protein [Punctularia strigosozonata HHB-11173 SS5]EIN08345.1 RNA-binding domain-containing protein [Punctularia strigosozonata HHB-11173 SS5]
MATRQDRSRKPYGRPDEDRPTAEDGSWLHDKAPGTNRQRRRSPVSAPANAAPNSRLVVSGLHYEVTAKDLINAFGHMGTLVREPLIKYDRSGRSTGVAIVTYETADEAALAKAKFDGVRINDKPMRVSFDTAPPKSQRSVSAPTSLLNRIEKPPLIDRLADDKASAAIEKPSRTAGSGPVRTRGGRGRGGAAPRTPRESKKPKTAEELDKELESFMGDTSAPVQPSVASADADVEMAS